MSGRFEKRRAKTLRPGWKTILRLGFNAALVLLAVFCVAGLTEYRTMLRTQTAADRWRGESETRFAQVSVFLPVDGKLEQTSITTFRQTLDQVMVDASLEAPEGGTLWQDAYSGTGSVSLSGPAGKATATTWGVGGDFFLFHPYELLSGSYIAEADFAPDRVVLDENLAWQLFGSSDVAGMEVTIGERTYPVAGVVRLEDDKASKKAQTETAVLFMNYAVLNGLQETKIDCYEIAMPDPISGYAENMIGERFPVGNGVVVENSNRYSALRLAKVILAYGERSMNTHAVIYPYWENAARLTEDYAALYLLLAVLFALCPAITAVVWAVRTLRRAIIAAKEKTVTAIAAKIERKKEENYTRSGI